MEGGHKGTTRRDKWFPEELDLDAVLKTGSRWPTLRVEDSDESRVDSDVVSKEQTPTPTPSSSKAASVDVEALDAMAQKYSR